MNDDNSITRRVRLPSLQAGALHPSELEYALACELEPESGIPAALASATWRELESGDPSIREYEVTVRRREEPSFGPKTSTAPSRHSTAGRKTDGKWMRRATWAAAAIGSVILIACAADFSRLAYRAHSLRRAIDVQMPLDAELKRLASQERTVRDEERALRLQTEARKTADASARRARCALPGALDALAAALGSAKSRATVRSIESPGDFSLRLQAIATSPEAAADALAELTQAAIQHGWSITPGDIVSSPDGLTAAFSFSMSLD